MPYESLQVCVHSIFKPNTNRGYWANPNDFIYAGLGLAFRVDVFALSWYYIMETNLTSFVLAYLISLMVYIIPFMVIQSFLGQFSSSGYISALRIKPIFKGLGYAALVLNIFFISVYSIFATVPLAYMFSSMQPTLPWSCEGLKEWTTNLTKQMELNLCNVINESDTNHPHYIPSELYFRTVLIAKNYLEFSISWQLIVCDILVWAIATVIIWKFFNTEKLGQIIRYTVWVLLALLVLLITRFSLLPGSNHVFRRFCSFNIEEVFRGLLTIPYDGIIAFGPGWGLFIALSSFNKFRNNIIKQSCLIGLGQMGIVIGLVLLGNFMGTYFKEATTFNYVSDLGHVSDFYLSAASAMSDMAWANLWSILYYLMLFLAAMLLTIVQLYTILTTILDELEVLRAFRVEILTCLVIFTAFISLYFISNHGYQHLSIMFLDTYCSHAIFSLMLILIVLWIYGYERFQRDMKFMINVCLSKCQIMFLMFIAPFFLLMPLGIGLFFMFILHVLHASVATLVIFVLVFIVIPWFLVPIYAIYYMYGFYKSSRTQYWYPVKLEDCRRYDEIIANQAGTNEQIAITNNESTV